MSYGRHSFVLHEDKRETRIEERGDADLPTILDTFERYLRACGYCFDGHVTIEDDHAGRGEPANDE